MTRSVLIVLALGVAALAWWKLAAIDATTHHEVAATAPTEREQPMAHVASRSHAEPHAARGVEHPVPSTVRPGMASRQVDPGGTKKPLFTVERLDEHIGAMRVTRDAAMRDPIALVPMTDHEREKVNEYIDDYFAAIRGPVLNTDGDELDGDAILARRRELRRKALIELEVREAALLGPDRASRLHEFRRQAIAELLLTPDSPFQQDPLGGSDPEAAIQALRDAAR